MPDNQISQKSARGRPRQDVEERFWSRVNKTTSCWLWLGTIDKNGFAVFKLPKAANGEWWAPWSGTNIQAHIFSAMLADFHFSDGHYLKHTCRTRACVNVAHLVSCAPVDALPEDVDTTNESQAYWNTVLCKNGLSMFRGLQDAKLFYKGLCGRRDLMRVEADERDTDGDAPQGSIKTPLTATAAFWELMRQAEETHSTPLPAKAPEPAPPNDDTPWRGFQYESSVRKLDKKSEP